VVVNPRSGYSKKQRAAAASSGLEREIASGPCARGSDDERGVASEVVQVTRVREKDREVQGLLEHKVQHRS
jgi:hypothetical protein